MNLPAPIRFGLWVLSGMTPATAVDPRRDEQTAAMRTYPTTGRSVMGAPRKRPRAVTAAGAVAHRGEVDERHTP